MGGRKAGFKRAVDVLAGGEHGAVVGVCSANCCGADIPEKGARVGRGSRTASVGVGVGACSCSCSWSWRPVRPAFCWRWADARPPRRHKCAGTIDLSSRKSNGYHSTDEKTKERFDAKHCVLLFWKRLVLQ